MIKYPALLFEDGAYIGVEFPDLPGCFTQADNLTQAIQAAKKALHCYLADVDEKDYPTPKTYPDAVEIEMTSADDDSPKTPPEAPCFSYGEEGGSHFNSIIGKTVVAPALRHPILSKDNQCCK